MSTRTVFTYMGPLRSAHVPVYDCLTGRGSGGGRTKKCQHCNWLQIMDHVVDPVTRASCMPG